MAILAPLFGIFTSFILLYYLSSLNRSNTFLALFFLCCNSVLMVYFGLHYSKIEFWEGICFVHFLPLSFLLGPALFFYVKHTVSEDKQLHLSDLLHLIPAIFTGLATLPFTTLSLATKTAMAHEIVNITEDYNLNFQWVTFEQILYGRSIHLILYCVASVIYFLVNKRHLLLKYGALPSNHRLIQKWIFSLIFLQLVIAGNSLGHMLTVYAHNYAILGIPSNVIFSEARFFAICGGGFFVQNFILFLFPKILYGNVSYEVELSEGTILQEIKSSLPKKSSSFYAFERELEGYLASHPFVKKDFSLSQMSFDLKMPERFLSNYFNKEMEKTFGEWKNDLRIEYACQLIEEGNAKKITIEAISTDAGFVSRSKFIDAFKARKGVTPSTYIKEKAGA
ncbi:helix-turn-helix domain-containing protein [Aquirufa antheringensis]|uniref:helix-turn-helix domain-containing protein n=1 Tax=Aquirufa antheringensis TaxID=2516559 RepID=UPI00208F6B85|nr:AraC family transcriptional regulator [Aquirufa antheringensis]USQ03099.1 helix-turn-helix transcriptional regulator [Aquirufa antheringensis]